MNLDECNRVMRRFRSDPCGWTAHFLPTITLADYQESILQSAAVHTETWVPSANGVGKTLTAAIASLWFFLTRPSIVVTISPSADQLEHSLWLEIRHLLTMLRESIGDQALGLIAGNGSNLEIKKRRPDGSIEPRSYMAGKCVAKTESLQGVHLPRLADGTPTVMFTGEEATGIDDRFFPVVRTSSHSTLMIFNPIRTDGEAYQMTHKAAMTGKVFGAYSVGQTVVEGRPYRNVIRVSGEDSPNVAFYRKLKERGLPFPAAPPVPGVLDYETFLELKATLPPWELRPRLYGLCNDESTAKLFPSGWLDLAVKIHELLKAGAPDRKQSLRRWLHWWGYPFGLGVDCAHGGGDLSAWCVYGRWGAVNVETLDTPNTRTIKKKTLELMRRWRIKPEWVAFDRAIGKGIADELREDGKEVNDVGFGESALDTGKYPNMRVELYGELAEAMAKAFDSQGKIRAIVQKMLEQTPDRWHKIKRARIVALPEDTDLRQELFVLPRAQDSRDRLSLPPKDGTKSILGIKQMLGGRSPDRSDAVVLARYAWERGQEHRRLSRPDGPLVY